MNKKVIDIVYTWVNGNDQEYNKLIGKYAKSTIDSNPERYRDIYSLLKFSLRSVEQYVPWVRDIYLFTCRPQIPDWLNTNHPRMHVIHHDEVIKQQYLPTFSCNAIESFIHQIPGTAPYILYLNDDYLFGRKTDMEDFLTKDNKINVYGTLFGEYSKYRIYDGYFDIVSLGFIEHTPYLIYKPFWIEMLDFKKKVLINTRNNKFRKPDDLSMDKLYRYYLLANKSDGIKIIPFYKTKKLHTFHKITNNYNEQVSKIEKIKLKKPKFYCLNDDQRGDPNKKVISLIKKFLYEYYPKPSSFEK